MKTYLNTLNWLRRALFDWLIITGCFIGIYHLPILVLPLAIVIGARQHALGILGHDGAHRLVSRNKTINDVLTTLFAFGPLGFHLGGYRRFHFEHHRELGTQDDPELQHKYSNNPFVGEWFPPLTKKMVVWQVVSSFFGFGIPHAIQAIKLTWPSDWKDFVFGPALVITLMLLTLPLWVILIWFGCLMTTFMIPFRLRIWTEHVGTHGTHIIEATPLERFLLVPHNTYYHYEHHKFPSVPCGDLPNLRKRKGISLRTLIKNLSNIDKGLLDEQ